MDREQTSGGSVVSEGDALKNGFSEPELWLRKIAIARREEKDWRASAEEAVARYEAHKDKRQYFGILYSNIETSVPALYNSTPVPDARRRWSEDDAVARTVADLIERSISYSVDVHDFNDEMKELVRDGELTGRGTGRVRYRPEVIEVPPLAAANDDADELNELSEPSEDPEATEPRYEIISQCVELEWVQWDRWGRGPGKRWQDIPFVWFDHDMTMEEVEALISDRLSPEEAQKKLAELGFGPGGFVHDKSRKAGDDDLEKGIFATIPVIEVWDKIKRRVIFMTPNDKMAFLRVSPDPYRLKDFFPVPRPLQRIRRRTSLEPVVPHELIKDLVEELDSVSRRIRKLVAQLKVRGVVDPKIAKQIARIVDLEDGEFLPAENVEQFVAGGNGKLSDLIHHMPLAEIIAALKELNVRQEAIKQQIFEVSGLSDILRGATNPDETLGAQKIKATWGSQRVQMAQGDVARYARDVFRMFAEIISKHYEWPRIKDMTGIKFDPPPMPEPTAQPMMGHNGGPPMDDATAEPMAVDPMSAQPAMGIDPAALQAWQQQVDQLKAMEQEVERLLRSDLMAYRIDIETDSTIRGDMAKGQQELNNLITAMSQFGTSLATVAPVIPGFVKFGTTAFATMIRNFRIGRQGEEALDKFLEELEQPGAIQNPKASQATPEQIAAEDAAADKQRAHETQLADKKSAAQESKQQHDQTMVAAKADAEARKVENAAAMSEVDKDKALFEAELQAQYGAMLPPVAGEQPGRFN